MGGKLRRFRPSWFVKYPSWLEYSVEKDTAYCLYCYLFKAHNETWGGDSFTTEGFRNWRRTDRFEIHVEGPNSAHNKALEKAKNLLKQKKPFKRNYHNN